MVIKKNNKLNPKILQKLNYHLIFIIHFIFNILLKIKTTFMKIIQILEKN